MANTFKSAPVTLSNSTLSTIYTASSSSGTQTVIHAVYVSNKHSSAINCDIVVRKSSTNYYLAKSAPIPAGSTLTLDKPVNLENSDIIKVKSSNSSGLLDVFVSVLEIT
tara:strand:- start:1045 stop:1371 length:327 start_codon:yes stop_codon:yes gene_type:complete